MNQPVTKAINGQTYTAYGTWFEYGTCSNFTTPTHTCEPNCAITSQKAGTATCKETQDTTGKITYQWDITKLTECQCLSATEFPQLAPLNGFDNDCAGKTNGQTCTPQCNNFAATTTAAKGQTWQTSGTTIDGELTCVYGQLKNFGGLTYCQCDSDDAAMQKYAVLQSNPTAGAAAAANDVWLIGAAGSGSPPANTFYYAQVSSSTTQYYDPGQFARFKVGTPGECVSTVCADASPVIAFSPVPWPTDLMICDGDTGNFMPHYGGGTKKLDFGDISVACKGTDLGYYGAAGAGAPPLVSAGIPTAGSGKGYYCTNEVTASGSSCPVKDQLSNDASKRLGTATTPQATMYCINGWWSTLADITTVNALNKDNYAVSGR
jgi:hypothetical protein